MIRSTRRTLSTLFGCASLVALTTSAAPAGAAVYTVTKTADTADGACSSDCSLREAILAANANAGSDFILLGPGTYTLTLAGAGEDLGATGDLDIRDDVAIVGASAETTVIDGGQIDRVFDVPAGVRAEIQGVTIRNGKAAGPGGGIRNAGTLDLTRVVVAGNSTTAGGFGGGLWSGGSGSQLTLAQSTVWGNTAESGGGLSLNGPARVSNTTIAGNRANSNGGGLYVFANTDAAFTEVTVASNTAVKSGGGVFAEISPFIGLHNPQFFDSILAGNTGAPQRDCAGTVQSGGYNLVGDASECIDLTAGHHDLTGTLDPRLGPLLVNNGGTTPTLALLTGSPARGAGHACGEADQRGQTRPAAGCDIGAFQVGTDCLTGGPTLCLNNDRFRVTVDWRNLLTSGSGHGVSLSGDSGYFWFFGPANAELIVKVLNGCGLNHRYWVFLGGLTNVETRITVTDTKAGVTKLYTNPLNRTFATNLDTGAFATCP